MPSERIRVAIRVRPAAPSAIAWSDGRVCIANTSFRCDTFLDETMDQDAAYAASGMAQLVESVVDGYSSTIFAYGQTGAGKSHTIFGPERNLGPATNLHGSQEGFLPRSVAVLMEAIERQSLETRCSVRMTVVEIYNDTVHDLVQPSGPLAVRWSKDTGFFLEDATVVECSSYDDIMHAVLAAAANRVHSSHHLNDRSNRSHCLVTIYVDSQAIAGGERKYGKLTIVDLAGSERAHDTGAVGTQLKESGYINKSLYCLSQVILALNSPRKDTFVPFRDSKLTMLLIDSLGGRSRTLMLACVNASPQFARESIRTLEFAMGVARIRNEPTVALSPQDKLVRDLRAEIKQLKHENEYLRSLSCLSRGQSMPALPFDGPSDNQVDDGRQDGIRPRSHTITETSSAKLVATTTPTITKGHTVPTSAAVQQPRSNQSRPRMGRSSSKPLLPVALPILLRNEPVTSSERPRKSTRASLPLLARDARLDPVTTTAAAWDDERAADLFAQLCQL
ncbi:kinesin-like protein [Achlya hypogyna]|uniref:Kinesin-like protein n=1 Tax=Achlya hypogyna TaxID=1202772 RepID=A0A1V9Y612_ACHHY|nr:kinesin-like protein [Achlya hypogyna]